MRLAEILPNIPDFYTLDEVNIETIQKTGFIHFPANVNTIEVYRIGNNYFYVDLDACYLNESTFGQVFVAFPINIDSGEINKIKPVALNRFEPDENNVQQLKNIENTTKNLKRYFNNVSSVGTATKFSALRQSPKTICYFFTMEYFDGSPLITNYENTIRINPDLKNLSLRQIISLIREGAAFLDLLHHKTNRDPHVIIHSDIKSEGFLLVLVKERRIKNVNDQEQEIINIFPKLVPIDFGYAITLKNSTLTKIENCGGSLHTAAPEISRGQIGPKSDVFSFLDVIFALFQIDICASRWNEKNKCWQSDRPFELNNLLYNFQDIDSPELIAEWKILGIQPNVEKLLVNLINTFCARMNDVDYDSRPDTSSLLYFFTVLENYLLSYEMENEFVIPLNQDYQQLNSLEVKRNVYLTQLILHTCDLWEKKTSILSIIPNPLVAANSRQFRNPQLTTYSLVSELDFHTQPDLCKIIITSYQQNELSLDLINQHYVPAQKPNKISQPPAREQSCLIC